MTDTRLTAAALKVIRSASDEELQRERKRIAKLTGPLADAARAAISDEEDRRTVDGPPITPIAI